MMRPFLFAILAAASLALSACSDDNLAPVLSPLGDQRGFVNVELAMALSAADAEGDPLTFRFETALEGVSARATLEPVGPGRAVFRWTPAPAEIGLHAFDFVVSDGASEARATINIDVSLSGEGSGAPVFIQPLGTGSTLDILTQACLDVPVLVSDLDSPEVTLGQEEPLIFGAELTQDDALSGSWHFCPSPEQLAQDDRYSLTLSADDQMSAKTLKDYLIVIRQENKPDCPGDAPVVVHTPVDVSSVNAVHVEARVTDDLGIKYEPLLYYSTSPPSSPVDISQLTQLTMGLVDGDMQDGTWSVDIPNPVANQGTGATAELFYVIAAQDNDDTEGTCDHTTQAPTDDAFTITVDNPGGGGGLGLCEACTADAQCGEAGDHCLFMDNGYHCFTACADDSQCEAGYYCSISSFTSIDGAVGRECIPDDYQCTVTSPQSCVDDTYEENDSLSAAKTVTPGTYANLKSCPAVSSGDDEDWFKFVVNGERRVTLTLAGGSATDLDLALKTSSGAVLQKGDTLTSNETVSACLGAGTYYVHVYAYGVGANPYSLTYASVAESCTAPTCEDDDNEPDDNATQARSVDLNLSPYLSTTQAVCSMDDDWYAVPMFAGETLHASLTFSQANGSEDLDLYLRSPTQVDLTGCSEQTPLGCDGSNGQSVSSNEKLVWPIATSGTYYLVVHGWAGAENLYDICVGLSDSDCPTP